MTQIMGEGFRAGEAQIKLKEAPARRRRNLRSSCGWVGLYDARLFC
jgi:hypothetical protein